MSSSVERNDDVAPGMWTAVSGMLESKVTSGAVIIGSVHPAEEQDLFDLPIAKAARERV
jgi:hypothetical protein